MKHLRIIHKMCTKSFVYELCKNKSLEHDIMLIEYLIIIIYLDQIKYSLFGIYQQFGNLEIHVIGDK